jgi:hypothetical protein
MIKKRYLVLSVLVTTLLVSCSHNNGYQMRGVVLSVHDLETVDWPKLAAESGINTIGTHVFPNQVREFIKSDKGQKFLTDCRKYGIDVEHQLHSMTDLLPRELFAEDSTMFRMNKEGIRIADFNCCVHSEKALDIITKEIAKILIPTNHRYYFWCDDNAAGCECSECAEYSESEQALIIENHIIKALRARIDSKAKLAHLAYQGTLKAPVKIVPEDGIFLEFAPVYRNWTVSLADRDAVCTGNLDMTNGQNLDYLAENLKVFDATEAVILEYWLDVSLQNAYTKPAKKVVWDKNVFSKDIDIYANYGIRNITTFAVYMDDAYFKAYHDTTSLKEYAKILSEYCPPK